jgi:S1-C subfamily serine protease
MDMDDDQEYGQPPSAKRARVDTGDDLEDDLPVPTAPAPVAPTASRQVIKRNKQGKLGLPFGSVVKLHVKRAPWSFSSPWRRESQVTVTGTGFLVHGKRILTNAHVVENQVSSLNVLFC